MAVFTILSEEDIRSILSNYGLNLFKAEKIKEGLLNSIYDLKTLEGNFILRISESFRTFEEEERELEFVTKLYTLILAPEVQPTLNGSNHVIYNDKFITIFKKIEGTPVREVNEENISEVGSILGRLHSYTRNKSIDRVSRINLDFYINNIDFGKIDIPKEDKGKILEAYKKIKNVDFSGLPKGIIHNDLFPNNVIEENGKIAGVIDFNECSTDYFIFELAIIINFWIRVKDFSAEKQKILRDAFLTHYSAYRMITLEEIYLLDAAMTRVALTFILLRIYRDIVNKDKKILIENKSYTELMGLI